MTFSAIVGFFLTLIVLFYLIGDNAAFRVVVYLFVGVSAGYAAAVTWWQVLMPRVVTPIYQGDFITRSIALISLVMGVLLLMKLSPRTAWLGNPVIALLVGVGAAVAVGGAVLGTLFPQVQASINVMDLSNAGTHAAERLMFGLLMLIGTTTTLVYFHFGAKTTANGVQRNRLVRILGVVGQVFVAITLGTLFAGVLTASLTALIERMNFIKTFFESLAAFFHL